MYLWEIDKYRALKIVPLYGREPTYYASEKKVEDKRWDTVQIDKTKGVGYPKRYKTLEEAFVSVEDQIRGEQKSLTIKFIRPKKKKIEQNDVDTSKVKPKIRKVRSNVTQNLVKNEVTMTTAVKEKKVKKDKLEKKNKSDKVVEKTEKTEKKVKKDKAEKVVEKAEKKEKKVDKTLVPGEKKRRKTYATSEKRPGIVRNIIEMYLAATKEKPITLEKIHKALCKKFPERDADAMLKTTKYSIYWFDKTKDYKVNTDGITLHCNADKTAFWATSKANKK